MTKRLRTPAIQSIFAPLTRPEVSTTVPRQIGLDPTRSALAPLAKRGGFLDKYFYFAMSLLVAAVVAWGFGHTVPARLIHPDPAPPLILYAHAFAFSGWVIFFIVQSGLVRARKVEVHRTLGWFGLGLGLTMIGLGIGTAIVLGRAHFLRTHSTDGSEFMIVPFGDMICFAIPFLLAMYWRKKPEFHRRLILIATWALTSAAWGRFPHLPGVLDYPLIDLMILLGVARDWLVNRRVHPVYLYGLPLMAVVQTFVLYTLFHASPWWVKIAHAIVT
jgi:hypothetical protein